MSSGIVCYRCHQEYAAGKCGCKDGVTLIHGDCREVLPLLEAGSVDLVLTDPPYLTSDSRVPTRGRGVGKRILDTNAVGLPWGYSLDWINAIQYLGVQHWIVFANYRMLAGLCSTLPPQTVFIWRKSNAPRMTRPIPRLDCEFILWSRQNGATCQNMGAFQSMVLDVPMPQAGCMAVERICKAGTGKAAHPCQKPMGVVRPFIERLPDCKSILDPFAGLGTTGRAAKDLGRRCILIEIEERYCEIAARRLAQEVLFT